MRYKNFFKKLEKGVSVEGGGMAGAKTQQFVVIACGSCLNALYYYLIQ